MTLPEEYRVAREVYETIRVVPKGHCVSRGEINTRLRASSDRHKNDIITKVLRHMIQLGQVQKRMDVTSNAVYFWTLENMNVKGEKGKWDPTEPITNYLTEPPPPAPPVQRTNQKLLLSGPQSVAMTREPPVSNSFYDKGLPPSKDDEEDFPDLGPDDEDDEPVKENELYMMRDMEDKKYRLLLRPDGSTVRLHIDEVAFIKSLKHPYVTI